MKQPASDSAIDPDRWLSEYGSYLFRFAMSRVSKEAVAEDLVQDTLLAAMKAKDRFAGRSSEKTWLTGILKNKIVDHYRKSGRELFLEDLQATGDQADMFRETNGHWLVSDQSSPREWSDEQARHMDREEFWTQFRKCADRLPDTTRQVFYMRELEGVSGPDICKKLGISSQNFWVIMHRARGSLRKCLEANWFAPQGG